MSHSLQLTLPMIRERLATYRPKTLAADRGHAAVTMILRDRADGPEALFIIRSAHDQDPWSGDIGFPGGRIEPDDPHPQQAAEREVMEELALDLGRAELLGRLDDLYGATLPILVSCFVYLLDDVPPLVPNHEVADTFWFGLNDLLDAERHHMATLTYRGEQIRHPAVDMLGPECTVLWGITYRLVRNFFQIFDICFGSGQVTIDARR